MKKEATLNIKLTQELYDAVKADSEKYRVSMAAYVRAVLARQVYGKKTKEILGQEFLLIDSDNAFILDL